MNYLAFESTYGLPPIFLTKVMVTLKERVMIHHHFNKDNLMVIQCPGKEWEWPLMSYNRYYLLALVVPTNYEMIEVRNVTS
jgi:hypothetical protein